MNINYIAALDLFISPTEEHSAFLIRHGSLHDLACEAAGEDFDLHETYDLRKELEHGWKAFEEALTAWAASKVDRSINLKGISSEFQHFG